MAKHKKYIINPKNDDEKCFQYAKSVAKNFAKITNHLEKLPKTKAFMKHYKWKRINFVMGEKIGCMFKKNNPTITLNFLNVDHEVIKPLFRSKHKSKQETR